MLYIEWKCGEKDSFRLYCLLSLWIFKWEERFFSFFIYSLFCPKFGSLEKKKKEHLFICVASQRKDYSPLAKGWLIRHCLFLNCYYCCYIHHPVIACMCDCNDDITVLSLVGKFSRFFSPHLLFSSQKQNETRVSRKKRKKRKEITKNDKIQVGSC